MEVAGLKQETVSSQGCVYICLSLDLAMAAASHRLPFNFMVLKLYVILSDLKVLCDSGSTMLALQEFDAL